MVLAYADAVDIGHGRGRLAPDPAASLRRVDSAFGRAADINEAWRSPEQANANYARYLAYLRGGPWAPIALPADQSIHCVGYAVDTDDTLAWQIAIWNDHGWYWTVYRDGELKERWHLEYFWWRDNHRYDHNLPTGEAITEAKEWLDMASPEEIRQAFVDALRITDKENPDKSITVSVPAMDGTDNQVYWAVNLDANTKARLWNGDQLIFRRNLGLREALNQAPQVLDGMTEITVIP
ncbi:hypothetical protein SAMN04487848_2046 [Microbacterium sp. ru370.1]|uniref:hypothetical protein n=1 Tax=unclassified Microbacterium TaxID=2609290 RepID=UPI00088534E7|nr:MULTISPECIES: hypothetical protein [unclassified Microbacterium]SDO77493.1 hypothetical protein SAMN04487848_2046 [Microbacterium sp. ru370.1]SIT88872.1 hypothetical protein SAMN05880579_2041 [Microbacterium sp. RU1D]